MHFKFYLTCNYLFVIFIKIVSVKWEHKMDNISPEIKDLMDAKDTYYDIVSPRYRLEDFKKVKEVLLGEAQSDVKKVGKNSQATPENESRAVMDAFNLNFDRFMKEFEVDSFGKSSESSKMQYAKSAAIAGASLYQLKTGTPVPSTVIDHVVRTILADEHKNETLSKTDSDAIKNLSNDHNQLENYALDKIHSSHGNVSESLLDAYAKEIGAKQISKTAKMSENEYYARRSIAIHDEESTLSISKYIDLIESSMPNSTTKMVAEASTKPAVEPIKFDNKTPAVRDRGVIIGSKQNVSTSVDAMMDVLM